MSSTEVNPGVKPDYSGLLVGSLVEMVDEAEKKLKVEREAEERQDAERAATRRVNYISEFCARFVGDWPDAAGIINRFGAVFQADGDRNYPNAWLDFEFEGQPLQLSLANNGQYRLVFNTFHQTQHRYIPSGNLEDLLCALVAIRPELREWTKDRTEKKSEESAEEPSPAPAVPGPFVVKSDISLNKLQDELNELVQRGYIVRSAELSSGGGEYSDSFHLIAYKSEPDAAASR